jgi:hypothetical protein
LYTINNESSQQGELALKAEGSSCCVQQRSAAFSSVQQRSAAFSSVQNCWN